MSSPANITLESATTQLAIISLGANLESRYGGPQETLARAVQALQALSDRPLCCSSSYLTAAIDSPPDAPDFVNAVVLLWLPRQQDALALLHKLQAIELAFGRQRSGIANAPRTLDLDLICCGARQCQLPELELPHPRACERRFVLAPLAELAPQLILPGQTRTVLQQLEALGSAQALRRLE